MGVQSSDSVEATRIKEVPEAQTLPTDTAHHMALQVSLPIGGLSSWTHRYGPMIAWSAGPP